MTNDRRIIKFYYYDEDEKKFRLRQSLEPGSLLSPGAMIADIFISDFDGDQRPDIYIRSIKDMDSLRGNTTIDIMVLFQSKSNEGKDSKVIDFDLHNPLKYENLPNQNPAIFETYRDDKKKVITKILLQTSKGAENTREVYSVKQNHKDDSDPKREWVVESWKEIMSKKSECQSIDKVSGNTLSENFASSFVDINLDCRGDLILETTKDNRRYNEFYYFLDDGFCFVGAQEVPKAFSYGSFEDLNTDGGNDIVFVNQQTMEINVFFNRFVVDQRKLCALQENYKPPFESFLQNGHASQVKFFQIMLINQPYSSSSFSKISPLFFLLLN